MINVRSNCPAPAERVKRSIVSCRRAGRRGSTAGRMPTATGTCSLGVPLFSAYIGAMRPLDIQHVGEDLAIKWDDGAESFIRLEFLRRHCPCAGCRGEVDVMGNLYKMPEKPLVPQSFELRRIAAVGGYGIQPFWGDAHSSGIFSFDYLRQLANAQTE
jgi:DUF971 family protein